MGERPIAVRLAELGRLDDDPDIEVALRRISLAAAELIPGLLGVSLTVQASGHPFTFGASNEVVDSLDEAQYSAGDGPCLSALRSQQIVSVSNLATETRWSEWSAAARAAGAASILSYPAGGDLVLPACINVYGAEVGALDGRAVQGLMAAIAAQTTVLLGNLLLYGRAVGQATQLADAMVRRATIEQAKGVLMSLVSADADTAFAYLVRMSQSRNRKLRDIAQDVVDQAGSGQSSDHRA